VSEHRSAAEERSSRPARTTRRSGALPPVAEVGVASLALIIVGGIYMASYVPRRPPLAVPTVLLVASAALLVLDAAWLARLRDFAWDRFRQVGRWALLAYIVSAGMIEFAFVRDHTRGGPLIVVTLMLVIFAVDVPLIIGFTVARYHRPAAPDATGVPSSV
jgi:hypothetical protein